MLDVLDIHTHTTASGHAYNTIYEMAQSASRKGLALLGSKGTTGTQASFVELFEGDDAKIKAVEADIAAALVETGVRRILVAGGETSGAVVSRLGVRALRIGETIAPGVPWTETLLDPANPGAPHLALALKSGNFGGEDFFMQALGLLANAN